MRDDRRAMGGWLALAGAVALALTTGLVTIPEGRLLAADPPAGTPNPVASGTVTVAGRALYQAQCASCHGAQGEGTANGPTLRSAGAAGADFYLRTGRMPLSAPGQPVLRHDPRFSAEEIQALTDLVASFGSGPAIPQVTGGGDVGKGNELYVANCAACHGASGSGIAIGGGNEAANLGRATPVEIVEAMRIGPGVMPQFALPPDEEAAIAAYVTSLRTAPNPGGFALGGLGPVPEGFVAVALGLVLLVAVAMFVGRRTHEGQPEERE